jgi:DNA-binding CsgD family transcriptional regulator
MKPQLPLTPREEQVLVLIGLGNQNKQVAKELGNTVHVVNKQIASAKAKLNAKTKEQAVLKALQQHLISM